MQRFVWAATIVMAFGIGIAAGWFQHPKEATPRLPDAVQERMAALQQQVTALQEQLHGREAEIAQLRQHAQTLAAPPVTPPVAPPAATPPAAHQHEDVPAPTTNPADQDAPVEVADEPEPTVDTVLAHLYEYLDRTADMGWQARRRRTQALLDTLRELGEPAVEALTQLLQEGIDTRERSTAAMLLGELQDVRALPTLQEVLEHEEDIVMRRAAARGLSRLRLPDTIPLLATVLANSQDDRFVRMSAAYGLAQLGEPQGVIGLMQLFDESATDGRGRYVAFRALHTLNDAQALPFMRQLAVSEPEVSYRLAAIRFLAEHGDQHALPMLQEIASSPYEQPSVIEAAEQALISIPSKK